MRGCKKGPPKKKEEKRKKSKLRDGFQSNETSWAGYEKRRLQFWANVGTKIAWGKGRQTCSIGEPECAATPTVSATGLKERAR